MMGDIVLRDFRLGVDPLIFSKPVSRASYLLGKFLGNFFVLICCQSVFAITSFLLQWVPFSGMVVLPVRVVPYFKHFFMIVVLSHLALAVIYFTAGTITRSAKVVYGLADHDLTSGTMLVYRLYCLTLAAACLALAHLFFERKSSVARWLTF